MADLTLPNYRIERRLALGGMAEIYLGRQESAGLVGRRVIIKRILPEYAGDAGFIASFVNEAGLIAQLNHSNIVHLIDFIKADQTYLLIMEYVDGVDLADVLLWSRKSSTPLPLEVVLSIACDVCAGLHHAHFARDIDGRELSVVHRDVSPSNILMAFGDGCAKVADFGIARSSKPTDEKTKTGQIKGKIGYLAPEQVLGRSFDRRVDVFAVGTLLYEMLTQKHPFRADSDYETLTAIVHNPPPDPRAYRPELEEDLVEVVMRTLSKAPELRYATCAELQTELLRVARNGRLLPAARDVMAFLEQHRASLERIRDKRQSASASTASGLNLVTVNSAIPIGQVQAASVTRSEPPRPLFLAASAFLLVAATAIVIKLLEPKAQMPATLMSAVQPASSPARAPMTEAPAPAQEVADLQLAKPEQPKKLRRMREPRELAPAASKAVAGTATLIIPTPAGWGWANVYVDGRAVGETPYRGKVASGKHRVALKNTDLGHDWHADVDADNGKDVLVRPQL